MKFSIKRPTFILSDAGTDSHESNKLVLGKGIIPVIAARSNSIGDGRIQRNEAVAAVVRFFSGDIAVPRTTLPEGSGMELTQMLMHRYRQFSALRSNCIPMGRTVTLVDGGKRYVASV